jgi:predicted RNA-binding protein YlxR (DUF448 family)
MGGTDDAAGNDDEQEQETGPERRCIVTGRVAPKAELLRFAVSPDAVVVPDLGQSLPGRGLWLSARRDVVNTAVAKRLFARAARRQVSLPDGLADQVEALLVRRCLDGIGLARRAGQAVSGYEKVRAEVEAGRVALLVLARDAAAGGRDKVKALARGSAGGDLPLIELFDGAELGAVFGRDAAVHVCLSPGKLARRILQDAALLAGFRGGTLLMSPIPAD